MTANTELSAPKRRTRAEVQQWVAEFVSSGMRQSEFALASLWSWVQQPLKLQRADLLYLVTKDDLTRCRCFQQG
jgi:hypothetical protein